MALAKAEILEAISGMTVLELSRPHQGHGRKIRRVRGRCRGRSGRARRRWRRRCRRRRADRIHGASLQLAATSKVNVIKVVRAVTGLGLKEAKDLVDGAPKAVKEGVSKADADAILKQLDRSRRKAEIK